MTRRGAFAAALILGLARPRCRPCRSPARKTSAPGRSGPSARRGTSRTSTASAAHPPVRGVVSWQHARHDGRLPAGRRSTSSALVGLAYRLFDPAVRRSSGADRGGEDSRTLLRHRPDGAAGLDGETVHRRAHEPRRWVALAYWLNPATIINGEVLGYLDPLMMLPGDRRLRAASPGRRRSRRGSRWRLAMLTKPQAHPARCRPSRSRRGTPAAHARCSAPRAAASRHRRC